MNPALAASAPSAPDAGYRNMRQLIELRWIAVLGQITTIATVGLVFGVALPMPSMVRVLLVLIAFNIFSHLRWHERRDVDSTQIFLALLVDVFCLSAQLYLSGGITNPFILLYLLQIMLSAMLLSARASWTIVGIVGLCLVALTLFARPLALPLDHVRGIDSLYLQGILISLVLNTVLLVIFITRISANLRAGDAQLAGLRQRAVEEEHIVRMGLLASGAAHELGTPLATLAVILGDWRHMPEFANNPMLMGEIGEMQTQLKRCKTILSGILMSAGEARGESSVKTTIRAFLEQLLGEWRAGRTIVAFEFDNRIEDDLAIVSDSTIKQMICNVLDNALEASPEWLQLEARREADTLRLIVRDAGPGFASGMLEQFGKPYQSTKGRPGGGLGLFLVLNVARTLGGTVQARNRPEGGAEIELNLPLAAIALERDVAHVR
jgi:two-component system sensor histidine kinase RegB